MAIKFKRTDGMIQTLKLLHTAGHKSAIIAGGAIRDTYHDIMYTDVDIYIQHPKYAGITPPVNMPNETIFHSEAWNLYWWDTLKLSPGTFSANDDVNWLFSAYTPEDAGSNPPEMLAVWDVLKDYTRYQIIFTTMPPIKYVEERFDFGLCKAYHDGTKAHFSRDFMTDARNHTLTLVGTNLSKSRYDYSMEHHLPRLQEKYPGYKIVIAPWNSDVAAEITVGPF